jgi:hypothetical protein
MLAHDTRDSFSAKMKEVWFPMAVRDAVRTALSNNSELQVPLTKFKESLPECFMQNRMPSEIVDLCDIVALRGLAQQVGDQQLAKQILFLQIMAETCNACKHMKACSPDGGSPSLTDANVQRFIHARTVFESCRVVINKPGVENTFSSLAVDNEALHFSLLDMLVDPTSLGKVCFDSLGDEIQHCVDVWKGLIAENTESILDKSPSGWMVLRPTC